MLYASFQALHKALGVWHTYHSCLLRTELLRDITKYNVALLDSRYYRWIATRIPSNFVAFRNVSIFHIIRLYCGNV